MVRLPFLRHENGIAILWLDLFEFPVDDSADPNILLVQMAKLSERPHPGLVDLNCIGIRRWSALSSLSQFGAGESAWPTS
jgi:hypothetical protein